MLTRIDEKDEGKRWQRGRRAGFIRPCVVTLGVDQINPSLEGPQCPRSQSAGGCYVRRTVTLLILNPRPIETRRESRW